MDWINRFSPAIAGLLFQTPIGRSGALLWGGLCYCICLPIFFRKKELFQNLCIAALFLYAALLLQSFQLRANSFFLPLDGRAVSLAISSVEWNPFFLSSFGISNLWTDLWRHFLILLPLGILVPPAAPRFKLGQMLILSLLCGAALEALQLFANIVSESILYNVSTGEIILSASGCLTGYLALTGLKRLPLSRHRARHYLHSGQAS